MKKILKNKSVIYSILIFCYLTILIIGLINHEFWRDELQAWTIARDLSIVDIFKQMKWEGHPCLWHLIIMPFAKLGLPPISMGVVSVVFMLLAAIFIMYKSPFHLGIKVLLILSSPFLYFYSIQSRVYSIIPFIICLLAVIYPKRIDKPLLYALLLAFLTNTHIMMSCFVGILSLFYFFDIISKKKYKKLEYLVSLGIIIIGILVLFLQIRESLYSNSIVSDMESREVLYSDNIVIDTFYQFAYGLSSEIESYTNIIVEDTNVLFVGLGFIAVLLLIGLILSFRTTVFGVIPFVFIFLLHVFIWFSLPQRAVMLIIFLMFAAWVHYSDLVEKGKKTNRSFIIWEIVLGIICLISIPYGIYSYRYDINNPVSGALDTAKYIEENLDEGVFICPLDYVATSVAGYIDEDIFYSNIRQDYFTFVNWDSYWRKEVSFNTFYTNMIEFVRTQSTDVYILYSRNFLWSYDKYINFLLDNSLIKELYISPQGLNSESYVIYEFIK